MLTISPAVRIYVAIGATDLRRSIDGLSALVRQQLQLDPLSGHLFLFRNRRGDRLKMLLWDQSGASPVEMRQRDLLLLLSGVDVTTTRRRRWYDRLASDQHRAVSRGPAPIV
jgi:transposase